MAQPVRAPVWRLEYAGVDVTREISRHVVQVGYTDHAHGEADSIEIRLEDADGRWRGAWYPAKGDQVSLLIGYAGDRLMPCGRFEIDELEFDAPPDTITMRGLAAGITPALRTENTRAFEGLTLRQIAETVAGNHQLQVTGTIDDIRIGRLTQLRERDLAFLKRLAEDYGHVFSVRGSQLVFHRVADLEAVEPVTSIDRRTMKRIRLTDRTRRIYRGAIARYHDPDTKQLIEQEVMAGDDAGTGDMLKILVRAENAEQAEAKARAALARANGITAEGTITVEGEPRLVAGNNVDLTGLGRLDGKYEITTSTHRIDRRSGYQTEIEVRGVG